MIDVWYVEIPQKIVFKLTLDHLVLVAVILHKIREPKSSKSQKSRNF